MRNKNELRILSVYRVQLDHNITLLRAPIVVYSLFIKREEEKRLTTFLSDLEREVGKTQLVQITEFKYQLLEKFPTSPNLHLGVFAFGLVTE